MSFIHFWFLVRLVSFPFLWILMSQWCPVTVSIILQKIISIIFLIRTICKKYHFWSMYLCSTSIIKITVKKLATSPECFVCFWWDLQNWKEQSFNLTIGMEGITQLLKSNFERSKCKRRHQCHAFSKKGTFFWTCPFILGPPFYK